MNENKEKKSKFDQLDEEFRNATSALEEPALRRLISDIALAHASLMAAQKDDKDWADAKERYGDANQQYAESNKFSRLKIAFCRETLKSQGKKV